MKLIAGLGNPGREYERTRHNAGFLVIDEVARRLDVSLDKNKCKALYGIYRFQSEKILLVKPQTYMNLSGQSIVSLMHFYHLEIEDLLIIHDDLDLPLGKLRLRTKGSSGGQKGMGNIIDLCGTDQIRRIRVGISNNKLMDTKDYVLGTFSKDENVILENVLDRAAEAVLFSFSHDFEEVMSKYNG